MIQMLHQLRQMAEESKFRHDITDHRVQYLEHRVEPIFEFVKLMFEATDLEYEERLHILGVDGIGKYTLAEVESCRFMTKPQFDVLRSSR